MKTPVYLDNNATTPMDPRVFEAMRPYFVEKFGNAASRNHPYGWVAEEAVEIARQQVAELLHANEKEIVFTSGATESDNIAIKGAAEFYQTKGNHIVTTNIEHKAVLDTCKYLEGHGVEVTYLPVDTAGRVTAAQIAAALKPTTILVSVMAANNEIGTLNPIAEIGRLCHEKGVLFHTDATQAIGKIDIDVEKMNIDILSMSGHKIYGPKGVGALYVRRRNPRVRLEAVIHGGGHERGMRSGTLNTPGIVGLGKACELCRLDVQEDVARLTRLRDKLQTSILAQLDECVVNGHPTERLCNTCNISYRFVEGEGLMMGMNTVAVSSGSACTSASLEPSYVLKALGAGDDLAHSAIRYSLGRFTTEEEVDLAIAATVAAVRKLRDMSPLYEMAKEGIDLSKVKWQHS